MSDEEEDIKPQQQEDAAAWALCQEEDPEGCPGHEEPYDNFKIISKKALADYARAEELFLDFLATADVWSSAEVGFRWAACRAHCALAVHGLPSGNSGKARAYAVWFFIFTGLFVFVACCSGPGYLSREIGRPAALTARLYCRCRQR